MKLFSFFYLAASLVLVNTSYAQVENWESLAVAGLDYQKAGNLTLAEQYLERALIRAESEFGKNHNNYSLTCTVLANVYKQDRKYARAEPLYIQARQLRGKNHPDYVSSCFNLALFYDDLGIGSKAEPLYLEAMELYSNSPDNISLAHANSCNNLALIYKSRGDLAQAEPLFLKANKIYQEAAGKENPSYAASCNNLANLYEAQGNYSSAEEYYLEATAIIVKVIGKDNVHYALCCNNLAELYVSAENYNKALPLHIEAKELRAKLLGVTHPDYAQSCNNLAALYVNLREFRKALLLYAEAREIYIRTKGKESQSYARISNNLGSLHEKVGEYEKAEEFYLESLNLRARILGKNHPAYAITCNNLAGLYVSQKKLEKASPLYAEVKNIQLNQIRKNFKTLSETEQQKYYHSIQAYFNLYAAYSSKYYTQDPSIGGDLYDLQLAIKGLILQSSQKIRRKIIESGDPALEKKYEALKSARNDMAKIYQMSLEEKQSAGIDQVKFEAQINIMEKELSEAASKYNIRSLEKEEQYSWQQIRSHLKQGEAAIEMIRVRTFEKGSDTIYLAVIITAKSQANPELIVLGNGAFMETKGIKFYKNSIQHKISDEVSYNVFWKPVSEKLAGINKVYFSADGVYHQISLSTLRNPQSGMYIADEISIQLVGATADLLRTHQASKPGNVTLFGFPDYKGGSIEKTVIHSGDLSSSPGNLSEDKTNRYFDAATMSVLPLPGTLTEVTNIKNLLEGGNLTVEFFAGKDATEANIKKVKYPKILHIATHGFFLPNLKNKDLLIDKETIQNEKNVLLRSGLLLAGCEKSMKGEGISSEEDGIFTAYEAMNLFLDETDLVVLSACETGLGEVQNGEGVYGLQRAFQQAGAKSILISLWKVNDHATELLMTNFYNDFLKSGDQKQSFINAQKAVRKVYPEPYYWGAFVMVGTQ